MLNFSWHEYSMIVSALASIAGIILLTLDKTPAKDDMEIADHVLLKMAFSYWLVYCLAFGFQKIISPEWEIVLLSVRMTGVIAYLLTASCILSLPLSRAAVRQTE